MSDESKTECATPEEFERRLETEVVDFQLARDILDALEAALEREKALEAQLASRPVAVEVPERAAWLTIEEIAAVVEEGAADYKMATLLRSHALYIARLIAYASMEKGRSLPPSRLLKEGHVQVSVEEWRALEDLFSHAKVAAHAVENEGECDMSAICDSVNSLDALRSNGGAKEGGQNADA